MFIAVGLLAGGHPITTGVLHLTSVSQSFVCIPVVICSIKCCNFVDDMF